LRSSTVRMVTTAVTDETSAVGSAGQFGEDGAGNEVFEFWKYGKLLGDFYCYRVAKTHRIP